MASHCAVSSKNFPNLNEKGPAAMRALFCWMVIGIGAGPIVTLNLFQGDGISNNGFKTSQTQHPGSRALDRSIRHRPLAWRLACLLA